MEKKAAKARRESEEEEKGSEAMDGGCAVEGMEGGRAPTLCTSRWWCGVGGHSSPSGYQMSKPLFNLP